MVYSPPTQGQGVHWQNLVSGFLLIATGIILGLLGVLVGYVEERHYYRFRIHRTRLFNPFTGGLLIALGLFCLWQGIALLLT